MHTFYLIVLVIFYSCQSPEVGQANSTVFPKRDSASRVQETPGVVADTVQFRELFVDSVNIGRKKLNKVEVALYGSADSIFVVIHFFSKRNGKWLLKNEFQFQKDGITAIDPDVSDYNNDGAGDITYVSMVAARAANEVRRLFIYNRLADQLVCIKNAEDYPNLLYNDELDCIDAFVVHGGSTTVFLKIQGDSLRAFAEVSLSTGLTVALYDKYGNEKVIYEDTTNKAVYVRYKNFSPLKVYKNY